MPDTAPAELYRLSLHDALPIYRDLAVGAAGRHGIVAAAAHENALEHGLTAVDRKSTRLNSQSPVHLVCRLLLEKKKQHSTPSNPHLNRNPLTTIPTSSQTAPYR